MNITFVVAVFPPEGEPSAIMAEELARSWGRSGHDVRVVCPFPSRPHGVTHPGFRRRWKATSVAQGIQVTRVWTWLIGRRRSHINRILENLTFGISAAIHLLFSKRPDIVVLESWPLLAQLCVLTVCRLRGIPLINYVKDLYPEALSAAGMMRTESRLYRFLLALDSLICRKCTKTVVISDAMRDYVSRTRNLTPSQVTVVRDWLDLDAIRPFPGQSTWRDGVGLSKDDMVFMYAGTMGYASKVNVLTRVAEATAFASDIRIVCIGEGVLKPEMLQEKEAKNLTNLLILPFQPRERVSEVQSCADVMLLLTSRNMGVSSVPSKLITYLAVGKPVLCAADENSDAAKLIRDNELGIVVEAENAQSIAEGMLRMRSLGRDALQQMGLRARKFAEAYHSVSQAVTQFQILLSPKEETGRKVDVDDGRVFAEWLERQGHHVVRTESSYWFDRAPRVYQAFPYHKMITPSDQEKREILVGGKALALRYSAPIHAEAGALSYHIVCETKDYSLQTLKSKYRSEVRRGVEACQVKQISLEQYAREGWELESDAERRQGRPLSMTKQEWGKMITAAIGLTGFEAWGAHVNDRLVASVFVFRTETNASILYHQSLTEFLPLRVNNALTFTVTKELFGNTPVTSIFYGLQPLDASPGVDKFKLSMGYSARPVRQCVEMHPFMTRPVQSVLNQALELAIVAFPRKESLRRSKTFLHVCAEGRRPMAEQELPELLLPLKDKILPVTGELTFDPAQRTTESLPDLSPRPPSLIQQEKGDVRVDSRINTNKR